MNHQTHQQPILLYESLQIDELDIIISQISDQSYHCASPPERSYYSPTRQEAYNYRQKDKSEQLDGLEPIEALLKRFTEDSDCHWALDYSENSVGTVTRLFSPTNQLSNSLKAIRRSFLQMPRTEPIVTTCLFYISWELRLLNQVSASDSTFSPPKMRQRAEATAMLLRCTFDSHFNSSTFIDPMA